MSAPVGPYSPARSAGGWIATSGQIGIVDGKLVAGGFDAELRQCLTNLEAVLASEGATMADVIKTNVYVRHMSDFGRLNDVWVEVFPEPRPARAAVGVAELPLGALVEVEAWAFRG